MMKIGTRISPDWLNRPNDLAFLKQIGVDCVDITLDICPGYSEAGGRANHEGLELRAHRQPNHTTSPAQRPANDHQQAYPVPLGCVRRWHSNFAPAPPFSHVRRWDAMASADARKTAHVDSERGGCIFVGRVESSRSAH